MFSIDCDLLNSKERLDGVSAHHEPAQAIHHLRFCNQQAEIHVTRGSRKIVESMLQVCIVRCLADGVIVIGCLPFCRWAMLKTGLSRIILAREILVVLHTRKRGCGFPGRSDQQGMAGNPRKECELVGQNFFVRTPRQASQLPGTPAVPSTAQSSLSRRWMNLGDNFFYDRPRTPQNNQILP